MVWRGIFEAPKDVFFEGMIASFCTTLSFVSAYFILAMQSFVIVSFKLDRGELISV